MPFHLTDREIGQFITEGFIKIDEAFSTEVANAALDILWKDIPFDRFNPATWAEPVVRLGMYNQKPFIDSLNTPRLHAAFDQLVGVDRWIPCSNVGVFPVRFPCNKQPADTGKHVDASFPGHDPGNFLEWRINVHSKGRALLMLVLYTDVSETDAPTLIYKKSHKDVAKLLAPYGDAGLSFMELAARLNELPVYETTFATGKPGTVYLCHPFLVHAAQAHIGIKPKFMAQPPLLLRGELDISRPYIDLTPVEQAISSGLR